MEETSIFDQDFEQSIKIRRRALIHVWLKIYLVGGILVGIFMLYAISEAMRVRDDESFPGGYIALIVFMEFYILKYVLIWLEVRTAIRWNWVVGALNTLLMTTVMVASGSPQFVWLELVSIPYWIMLWKIQDRWEKAALSGKELREL
jgi:hypothetical protein